MTHANSSGLPAVVALNGPPGSGKGWLAQGLLMELIPDAIICRPSDWLYGMMVLDGLIPEGITYQQYKELPDSRQNLIDYATRKRDEDCDVFSKKVTESLRYQKSRVVILDNFGFPDEVNHFAKFSHNMLVLRLDTQHRAREPYRSHSRRRSHERWAGDSRCPVLYHNQLTAYDSIQMALLLKWLTSPGLTSEEAGPYNEIRELWIRCFRPRESSGDLFEREGRSW